MYSCFLVNFIIILKIWASDLCRPPPPAPTQAPSKTEFTTRQVFMKHLKKSVLTGHKISRAGKYFIIINLCNGPFLRILKECRGVLTCCQGLKVTMIIKGCGSGEKWIDFVTDPVLDIKRVFKLSLQTVRPLQACAVTDFFISTGNAVKFWTNGHENVLQDTRIGTIQCK